MQNTQTAKCREKIQLLCYIDFTFVFITFYIVAIQPLGCNTTINKRMYYDNRNNT